MFGRGRAYNDWLDPYGIFSEERYGFDGDVNRASFAPVSGRAYKALDEAKSVFLKHLATVDTSAGKTVTEEIITFHLVPDMKKEFNKFVKEHGCSASQRKITREEQDKINKTRKSLMIYSSVSVSPAAQAAYLAKNPHKTPKTPVAGSSKMATATTASSIAKVAPPPLGTSQALKRSANDAHLDSSVAAGGVSKKQKL